MSILERVQFAYTSNTAEFEDVCWNNHSYTFVNLLFKMNTDIYYSILHKIWVQQ